MSRPAGGKDTPGWAGALQLSSTWAIWRGAVGDAAVHRHFAAQAVLSAEPLTVHDAEGRGASAHCVLIDPLAPHRLAAAPSAELIFLEPSRCVAAELEAKLRQVRQMRSIALLRGSLGEEFWTGWLSSPTPAPRPLDSRLQAAILQLEDDLPEGPTPLKRAAAVAGLSPERFRHLFAEEVGLPYRRFLLWRRLRLAAEHLLAGRDATVAAHAAGFADAAHLARTLRATFGVTASQLHLATPSA
ncbi:helix-turn-helix domain-containing protein [Phenylobacterium sp.]|uniref:helix-turn-helix domain-containing protein n=1 Tax=Phenylobacterium sp. TaxID=1871053 RepID=UPI0035C7F819